MKLRSFLGGGLLLRRLALELRQIRLQLSRQTVALERLAEHFTPVPPAKADPSVLADTGLSFLDAHELMLALDYIERSGKEGGRIPSDEEVLTYLADEKTVDLQERLKAREEELRIRAADRLR